MPDEWVVYLVRCRDGTLYGGVTNDLERRVRDHNRGKGAKYTSGRRPVTLVYAEPHPGRPSALRREAAIKRMPRRSKLRLAGMGC